MESIFLSTRYLVVYQSKISSKDVELSEASVTVAVNIKVFKEMA